MCPESERREEREITIHSSRPHARFGVVDGLVFPLFCERIFLLFSRPRLSLVGAFLVELFSCLRCCDSASVRLCFCSSLFCRGRPCEVSSDVNVRVHVPSSLVLVYFCLHSRIAFTHSLSFLCSTFTEFFLALAVGRFRVLGGC